jgi:hypothetical protein
MTALSYEWFRPRRRDAAQQNTHLPDICRKLAGMSRELRIRFKHMSISHDNDVLAHQNLAYDPVRLKPVKIDEIAMRGLDLDFIWSKNTVWICKKQFENGRLVRGVRYRVGVPGTSKATHDIWTANLQRLR